MPTIPRTTISTSGRLDFRASDEGRSERFKSLPLPLSEAPRVDGSQESRGATANDVNMLVCTGGRQHSAVEFRDLYAAAGFRLTRIVPTMAMSCVIEGVKT